MMLPALIDSPPYAFTPSIFGCESRPLREEPPAFFCAMSVQPSLKPIPSADPIDLQFREVLPVAGVLLEVLAAPHLEDAQLRVPPMRQHGRRHRGLWHQRRSHAQLRALAQRQHLGQHDLLSDLHRQRLHLQAVARADPVLLAARLDDREHRPASSKASKLAEYCRIARVGQSIRAARPPWGPVPLNTLNIMSRLLVPSAAHTVSIASATRAPDRS